MAVDGSGSYPSSGGKKKKKSGGGGGFGDPLERPAEQVAEDVRLGYVSREAAQRDYGVVLDAGLRVDSIQTEALRASFGRGEHQTS